jgi:hypothetical protein
MTKTKNKIIPTLINNWECKIPIIIIKKTKTENNPSKQAKQTPWGVCYTVALPFTLKSILRQKSIYENSSVSLCKNIIFKKIL